MQRYLCLSDMRDLYRRIYAEPARGLRTHPLVGAGSALNPNDLSGARALQMPASRADSGHALVNPGSTQSINGPCRARTTGTVSSG